MVLPGDQKTMSLCSRAATTVTLSHVSQVEAPSRSCSPSVRAFTSVVQCSKQLKKFPAKHRVQKLKRMKGWRQERPLLSFVESSTASSYVDWMPRTSPNKVPHKFWWGGKGGPVVKHSQHPPSQPLPNTLKQLHYSARWLKGGAGTAWA